MCDVVKLTILFILCRERQETNLCYSSQGQMWPDKGRKLHMKRMLDQTI